jgi:hypothetical protein
MANPIDQAEQQARNIATIGELERAAGITDRETFWLQFAGMKGEYALDQGVAELRQKAANKVREAT